MTNHTLEILGGIALWLSLALFLGAILCGAVALLFSILSSPQFEVPVHGEEEIGELKGKAVNATMRGGDPVDQKIIKKLIRKVAAGDNE